MRLELDDDGRRSRLTVFFRLLLAIPHFVWLALWTIAAFLAAIANCFVALIRGRSADALHRFLAAYVRYYAHLTAFVTLVANPFPGFAGSPGYPVDIVVDPPERQNRWITLFRGFLAIPAFLITGALSVVLFVIAFLGWFAALATGRMPTGLRNLGAFAVRYHSQTNAYWFDRHRRLPAREPGAAPAAGARAGVLPIPSSRRRRRSDESPARRMGGRPARARRPVGDRSLVALAERRPRRSRPRTRLAGRHPAGDARAGRPLRALLPRRVRGLAARPARRPRGRMPSTGSAFAKESAAGRIGTGMLLGMIGLALVWISQVPFRLAEVWWDRRYDQTDSGYLETLFANWFELGAEFLFICFALVVVMALAGPFPRRWWLAAAPVFVGLAFLFGFIYPYLTPTERLQRADLQAAGRAYAAKQGIDPVPLRVEDVTDFTSAPNAYAVGFGPSKRVVLWNTLLDGSFTDDEVKTVLAHEIGHHSSDHLFKGVAWYALFALPGAWLIARLTRRRGGMANPAAVPLSLLVIVVLDLLSLPVYNVISRHMEAEADWKALETTHKPEPAKSLFREFTIQSLNDPTRRRGRTSSSTAIRRCSSGSRWPTPGCSGNR